ncbi:hypothetical protein KQI30_02745 [Clostridium bornimense]|uniref:CD3324 family protein n=1 Tax=Clostridium bornimense TaxID=1216932 RepID=UPI001C0F5A9E|nr:CD3324 family protein [Clostridium bornimense]MBU5315194.1 hypothetical protein [Clostridium bornimense]
MKYRNASEILPDKLLREIQKYTSGEAIYIPQVKERQKWGEGSGARRYYEERNEKICEKFKIGVSMEELAEDFNLSVETIRKIIYKK